MLGGKTIGLDINGAVGLGVGGTGGAYIAFDSAGAAIIPYLGGGGFAGVGGSLSISPFVFGGSKDGLVGWGGSVGVKVALGPIGANASYIASSGYNGGAVVGYSAGAQASFTGFVSFGFKVDRLWKNWN